MKGDFPLLNKSYKLMRNVFEVYSHANKFLRQTLIDRIISYTLDIDRYCTQAVMLVDKRQENIMEAKSRIELLIRLVEVSVEIDGQIAKRVKHITSDCSEMLAMLIGFERKTKDNEH